MFVSQGKNRLIFHETSTHPEIQLIMLVAHLGQLERSNVTTITRDF